MKTYILLSISIVLGFIEPSLTDPKGQHQHERHRIHIPTRIKTIYKTKIVKVPEHHHHYIHHEHHEEPKKIPDHHAQQPFHPMLPSYHDLSDNDYHRPSPQALHGHYDPPHTDISEAEAEIPHGGHYPPTQDQQEYYDNGPRPHSQRLTSTPVNSANYHKSSSKTRNNHRYQPKPTSAPGNSPAFTFNYHQLRDGNKDSNRGSEDAEDGGKYYKRRLVLSMALGTKSVLKPKSS